MTDRKKSDYWLGGLLLLIAGKGGGDALDRAAKSATAYLKRQGYYS